MFFAALVKIVFYVHLGEERTLFFVAMKNVYQTKIKRNVFSKRQVSAAAMYAIFVL